MIHGSRFLLPALLPLSLIFVSVSASAAEEAATPSTTQAPAPSTTEAAPATAAQETPPAAPVEAPAATDPAAEEAPAEPAKGAAVDQETLDEAIAGGSVVELPNKTYYFLGARYRGIIVPKFMINLFADGGRTVYVHGFGPEFAIRKNGFEYNLSAWLALYDMKDTPLKGKSDDSKGWEIVSSDVNTFYFSSDFLWSNEFTPAFSLTYGAGVGLGVVAGKVLRTEAHPPSAADANDESTYEKCLSTMDSNFPSDDYCIDAKDQVGSGAEEPSWANGGSKPVIFPWLTLQSGLRYKMHRNFVARFDLGFGTSGFFFGVGADYGL
jgi:hypothetical protein